MPKVINWLTVDWTQADKDIAKMLGCSQVVVCYRRKFFKKEALRPKRWWQIADWTKTNKQIAKEFGKSDNTVAKKRVELGLTGLAKTREVRIDKGVSTPQPHLNKTKYQRLGTERAKQSPKAGRFETNTKAKTWVVKSPKNKIYTFTNLMHFVRTHEHLFDPSDVVWRKKPNGVEWCRASSGIGGLAAKNKAPNSWKGWKLISVTKTNQKE